MKKFLSLVLALVMTMSLVTVSAGAKDFTDDSSITSQRSCKRDLCSGRCRRLFRRRLPAR